MSEIKDEIRNGRIINKEVVTAAAEELAKKRNAKLTKEMMRIAVDSEFEGKDKDNPQEEIGRASCRERV